MLHFDRALAALPARDFMQTYLKEKWHAAALLVGYDHHFGRGGDEGFVNYVRYGRELGIDVVRARSFQTADVRVSSSATRRFLEAGNVEMARLCLGRPYRLSGTVVEGRRVGRHLGFPTANVAPDCADKLIPATGVYLCFVSYLNAASMKGVACLGTMSNATSIDNGTCSGISSIYYDGGYKNIQLRCINVSSTAFIYRLYISTNATAAPTQLFDGDGTMTVIMYKISGLSAIT